MLVCYACHSTYPENYTWCEKCKAPLPKPKLVSLTTCPYCGETIYPKQDTCKNCGLKFDLSRSPVPPLPDYLNWDIKKVKYGLYRRLGYPSEKEITPQFLLKKVIAEYKSSEAKGEELLKYVTSYLLAKTPENMQALLELANMHVELENYSEAIFLGKKLLPIAEKYQDEEKKAIILKILGISYFELGHYSVSKIAVKHSLNIFYHLNELEEWLKLSTYYFMITMIRKEKGETLLILNKQIDVIKKKFLDPVDEELLPVIFYLFNQFFWSPYENNSESYPSRFLPLIRKMLTVLEKVIIEKDIRFIHFIDYDRVLGVLVKAGLIEEAKKINDHILGKVKEDINEEVAVLLKWMGALNFGGLKDEEKEVWEEVLSKENKVSEKTLLNAIDIFKLRDLMEPQGVTITSTNFSFPEEYTSIITTKPTIFMRQNKIDFEPVETVVGLDFIFTRKTMKQIIKNLQQRSGKFKISTTIARITDLPIRKAAKRSILPQTREFVKNNEIIVLLLKKDKNQFIGLQFVSLLQTENSRSEPPESSYLLVGFFHKPKINTRPSDILFKILNYVWSSELLEETEILINKPSNPALHPLFKPKNSKH